MKKFIYLFIFAIILSSCGEDTIELIPYNSVNEQTVLATPKDFTNMILGSYSYMVRNGGLSGYGQELLIDSEVCTDNVILNIQGRQSNKDSYLFNNSPNSSSFSFYNSAYRSVTLANTLLNNVSKLQVGTFRNNIQGEALFIRALNHLELLRNFSKIPTQSTDANSSLGVAYHTLPSPLVKIARGTVQEGYQQVVSDLVTAASLIDNNAVQSGRANKAAVHGLLSRVYLYMGDYPKCIASANDAIALAGTPCSRNDFYGSANVGLWEDSSNSGVLFKLRVDIVDAISPGVAYSQASGSQIRSEYVVTKELFDKYLSTDIRKSAYFKVATFGANTYNNISKYDGRGTGQRNVVDIKILRIEEVYLNKAEAEYRLSGAGLSSLNVVKAVRYSGFVSGAETGASLLTSILNERRLELAFEMDRFYTLKRLGLTMTRSTTDGHFSNGLGTPPVFTNLPAGDYRWQFPIPQDEIDINNLLKQNPGY